MKTNEEVEHLETYNRGLRALSSSSIHKGDEMDPVGSRVTTATVTCLDGRDLVCPTCGDYLAVTDTCYGWYAICRRDQVRWCYIKGDWYIEAERWHPMNDRDRLTGLAIRRDAVT